ncbi:MAG: hypothetical protein LBF22_02705 [Deltaproteobacteria bacterium]|nr:hypothetical protein [Deltaproteobacteria bacterium]
MHRDVVKDRIKSKIVSEKFFLDEKKYPGLQGFQGFARVTRVARFVGFAWLVSLQNLKK